MNRPFFKEDNYIIYRQLNNGKRVLNSDSKLRDIFVDTFFTIVDSGIYYRNQDFISIRFQKDSAYHITYPTKYFSDTINDGVYRETPYNIVRLIRVQNDTLIFEISNGNELANMLVGFERKNGICFFGFALDIFGCEKYLYKYRTDKE